MIQQYIVGGAVRDILLGNIPKDIDYLWTGATPLDMEARNFVRVGASFPVFLDSDGDEHSLARVERKIGIGYNGFECNFDPTVTVEDDLSRRDLTVNAMCVRIEDWDTFVITKDANLVVDPFGGIGDLKAGILRHTSNAFSEDPIRVLRTARFASRYNFIVHPDTVELMRKVVPELYTVPQERVWVEFEKGLLEKYPGKMFEVLYECEALNKNGPLHPYRQANIESLSKVADCHDIVIRFVLISAGFRDVDYEKCCIPTACAQVAKAFNSNWWSFVTYLCKSADQRLPVLESLRAFSSSTVLGRCLELLEFYGWRNSAVAIVKDIYNAKQVDAAAIAAQSKNGAEIKQRIFEARLKAMEV